MKREVDESVIQSLMDADTHMIEPARENFFETSDRILKLSDKLSEEIILESIGEQLDSELDLVNPRMNYVSLFKDKYSDISPEDDCYDEEYLKHSLEHISTVISNGIKKRYKVELGYDLDYSAPADYFYDMETLYQFLFIRQYENLTDYILYRLHRDRNLFIESYSQEMEEETHSKDLFVVQSRKKFKNKDDVLIMHFLTNIIDDIIDDTNSAYDLFKEIASLDKYEEYNERMLDLLDQLGNKIVLNEDAASAKLYMSPLKDSSTFTEIRNHILMTFLRECEINE